jgi:biopolymer transport protein ExbD
MKLSAIAVFALCATIARGDLTWRGYMRTADETLFVLSVGKVKTSGWLAIGRSFDGFTIVAYDSKDEVLTLEKDGTRQVLHLVEEKIRSVSIAASPIVISAGGQESVFSLNSGTILEDLKVKFEALAASVPQPDIKMRVPGDTKADRLGAILDLMKSCGITRFSVAIEAR